MSKLGLMHSALKFKSDHLFKLSVLVWSFIGVFLIFLGFAGELTYFLLKPDELPSWWGLISVLIVVGVALLVVTVFIMYECSKLERSEKEEEECGDDGGCRIRMAPQGDGRGPHVPINKFHYEDPEYY